MTRKSRKYIIAGAVIYLMVIMMPIWGMVDGKVVLTTSLLSLRKMGLIWNSVKLGGTAAVIACVIGTLAALLIRNSFLRDKWYRFFFVMLLPIPYYLYALSWMYFMKFLSAWNADLLKYSMKGFGACLFVEVMTYIPLAMLFALIGMEGIKESTIEMALIYKESSITVLSIVLKQILPYLTAAIGCILALSVTDFSVPSMFQYSTYALDIFSVYSRNGSTVEACFMTIPIFVLLLIPLIWVVNGVRKVGIPQKDQRRPSIRLHGILRILSVASFGIVILQMVIPVVVYSIETGSLQTFLEAFQMIRKELLLSVIIALLCSIFSIVLVLMPAQWLAEQKKVGCWILFLFPMIVPGAILAIGLLHVINGSVISGIGRTSLLAALGCSIKYAPMLLLWCAVFVKRMDKKRIEMACVLANEFQDAARIKYRMMLPGILGAMMLAFFLTIGEESIMLVLMAPGQEAASVKIYNYLHYGASEYVSGFCLVIILFIFIIELAGCFGWRMLDDRKRGKRY